MLKLRMKMKRWEKKKRQLCSLLPILLGSLIINLLFAFSMIQFKKNSQSGYLSEADDDSARIANEIKKYIKDHTFTGNVYYTKLKRSHMIPRSSNNRNLKIKYEVEKDSETGLHQYDDHSEESRFKLNGTTIQLKSKMRIKEGKPGLQMIDIIKELKIDKNKSVAPKLIMMHSDAWKDDLGEGVFIREGCKVQNCHLKTSYDLLDTIQTPPHAIVITHGDIVGGLEHVLSDLRQSEDQIFILNLIESPLNCRDLAFLNGKINWTATYRRDSTIVTPYAVYRPNKDLTTNIHSSHVQKNWAKGKDSLIAWFVSNCGSKTGRLAYVKELQKYIQVDIYGICGPLQCPISEHKKCLEMLRKKYKFYLSLENSACQDYITEKLWNALR